MTPAAVKSCVAWVRVVPSWLVILVALVPAAAVAWQGRDLPQLGQSQDDGIYLLAGRSLAQDGSYRIAHLPGNPPQTKYPPLYPALLSLAWIVGQEWPANRPVALFLTWLWVPAAAALSVSFFRSLGWTSYRAALLAAVLAAHPIVAFIAGQLNADVVFSFFVLLTVTLAGRASSWSSIAMVALSATAACLTKTAGVALVVGIASYFLIQRRGRHAAGFAVLPLLVMALLRSGPYVSASSELLYYVDYSGFYRLTVGLADASALLQTNTEALLSALGGLVITGPPHEFGVRLLRYCAAAMAIRGVIRLARQRTVQPYLAFAGCYIPMLLVWNFAPNERLVLPLLALVLAGMAEEARYLLGRRPQWVAVPVLLVLWFGVGAYRETYRTIQSHREHVVSELSLIQAISTHVPPEQGVLAHYDTLIHLNSGHMAVRPVLDPMLFYHRRLDAVIDRIGHGSPGIARSLGLRYVLWTTRDYASDLDAAQLQRIGTALAAHGQLRVIHATEAGALYEVLDDAKLARQGARELGRD